MKGRSAVALVTAAVLAVVVAACGSSSTSSTGKVSGTSLTVYSSLPLQGGLSDVAHATDQGAAMALAAAGGKVGKYTITFKQLLFTKGGPQVKPCGPVKVSFTAKVVNPFEGLPGGY